MIKDVIRRAVLSLAVAGVLGFGASRAFAAPQGANAAKACDPWADARCNERCQEQGADAGVCDERYLGLCRCIYF